MDKIKKLYYSISEVSELTELKQYVLRYWETEFSQLNPQKNKAGNRKYRSRDIELIKEIKDLLYNKKFTIEGARQYFKNKKSLKNAPEASNNINNNKILDKIKIEIDAINDIINKLS